MVFTRFTGHCMLRPWPLTFWHQKLISTSMNPFASATEIGWNSLHWFLRYGVHKFFDLLPAVTLTFDLLNSESNQHIRARMHPWPRLGKIPFIVSWDMVFTSFSGRTDSRTHSLTHSRSDKPEYSMPPAPFFNGDWRIKINSWVDDI